MFEEDVQMYQRTLEKNSIEIKEYREMAKDCFDKQESYAKELEISVLERKEIETRVSDEIEELKRITQVESEKREKLPTTKFRQRLSRPQYNSNTPTQ